MFGRIRSEFQCLEGLSQYSHPSNDKVRIPVFQGLGQTSNVWKGKVRIQMLGRVGPEIQYLEG